MKKSKLIAIIVIITVVLIATGIGLFFIFGMSLDNKLPGEAGYEYDEDGNIIKSTFYLDSGVCQVSEYNENEEVIKSTTYDSKGNIKGWQTIEYDNEGNIKKLSDYNPDGTSQITEMKADGGIEFIKVFEADGSYILYEYNEQGKPSNFIKYDKDGNKK